MTPDELKKWRDRQEISQEELAAALGVHGQTVYRWENGARAIPPFLPLALQTIERQNLAPKKKTK